MARKQPAKSETPEWLVTFADLMSLLVCFFVLIISFSIQDQEKLQVVAGSMKDAFGIMKVQQKSGVIERDGNPERTHMKMVSQEAEVLSTEYDTTDFTEREKQGQEANTFTKERTDVENSALFNLASATLKQAFKDMPEITHIADNLIVQDDEDGVNIVIADQDGRAMFPEGSKYPYEDTRAAIAALAPILAQMPNQIRISGHTAAGGTYPNPRYGKWELSTDRANVVRSILEEYGVPDERIFSVVGKGDAEPYFPNDPYMSTNERISILLVVEEPPVPPDLSP